MTRYIDIEELMANPVSPRDLEAATIRQFDKKLRELVERHGVDRVRAAIRPYHMKLLGQ